jgi:hypothetical protein
MAQGGSDPMILLPLLSLMVPDRAVMSELRARAANPFHSRRAVDGLVGVVALVKKFARGRRRRIRCRRCWR